MPTETRISPSRVIHGAALVFEDIPSGSAPLRVRPDEDSLLRVICGLIRLTTDERELVLAPGEEAIIPAGTAYRLASISATGRTVTGFRSPRCSDDDRLACS